MQFTDEQAKAIQTDDKNLIVVAGAGSGKTRVLVERYLHLLDTHRDWRLNALVAITFTRAAALEMRDRVRKALEKRVQDAIPATDEHAHWSRLLAQMDSARIDTIHSMCATILRANAAEAAVDPQFEVLEPVESASLINDVIQSTLYEIGENDTDDLAPLFSEYDLNSITEALMDADLLSASLGTVPNAQTLFDSWQTDWANFTRDEIQRVSNTPALADTLDWLHAVVPPEGDKLT
ncbi:MAG: UvrD-helicase domain-containing protein, partial [Chloroflexota bacterium]